MGWFRMYADMPHDPKIGTLTDSQFRTWVELLCYAGNENNNGDTGLVTGNVSWALRRNIAEDLTELQNRNLLKVENSKIFIKNWSKRQFASDNSAGRVRKHREKLKEQESSKDETLQERDSNAPIRSDQIRQNTFECFWKLYPKKRNKVDAEKAWKKIKCPSETIEKIKQAISWQVVCEQWTKDNGQFIPYPATYLNRGGWEDEPPEDDTPSRKETPEQTAERVRLEREAMRRINAS